MEQRLRGQGLGMQGRVSLASLATVFESIKRKTPLKLRLNGAPDLVTSCCFA